MTVVNHRQQKSVFINIWKSIEDGPEDGVRKVIWRTETLTTPSDFSADYQLSRKLYNESGETQPVIVELDDVTVEEFASSPSGVDMYSSRINQELKSHTDPFSWAKMAGRTFIRIQFKNGSCLVFFQNWAGTKNFIYIPKSLIDANGNLVPDGAINDGSPSGAEGVVSVIPGHGAGNEGSTGTRWVWSSGTNSITVCVDSGSGWHCSTILLH